MLSSALWSKYFIEDLGFTVEHNILYQDNQASIRLETNGPASSSKRTKHIKRKYFLYPIMLHVGISRLGISLQTRCGLIVILSRSKVDLGDGTERCS